MNSATIVSTVFGIIGGLGLFLYGMNSMSSGLQKSSASTLKTILEKLTKNRVIGTVIGAIVTMVIQSSSATTVMVVGFVNAGLMNLTQALSIVLGANIGTTITAQIIAFKITVIALPAIGIGAVLFLFFKKPQIKYIGEILFGFGLLFFGMDVMTKSFIPLSQADWFKEIFIMMAGHPIYAVIAGTLTTFLVQSSSATIGITIALATTGVLDFQTAAALVLGENIGTTITANIAALNANRVAKQAALGHFLFNFIGVIYILILLYPFLKFIEFITPSDANLVLENGTKPYIARHIANAHTLFNIVNTIVFLPFLPLLAKLCERIIPNRKTEEKKVYIHFSDSIMSTPEIAVGLVNNETKKMYDLAVEMFNIAKKSTQGVREYDKMKEMVNNLNVFNKELSMFVDKLMLKSLSVESEKTLIMIKRAMDEIYQIGLRSSKVAKLYNKVSNQRLAFTEDAVEELNQLFDTVSKVIATVHDGYKSNNIKELSSIIAKDEELIDKQRKEYKNNHIKRLNNGVCTLEKGLIFVDILNTLEKIGDNSFNLTQLMIADNIWME